MYDSSHQLSVCEHCFTEQECIYIIKQVRWNNSITCIRCGSGLIYAVSHGKSNHFTKYACKTCKYQFSDISNSFFHKTRTPLLKWFAAILLVFNNQDITLHQMKNKLCVSYKTAWRMRHAIEDDPFAELLFREMNSIIAASKSKV